VRIIRPALMLNMPNAPPRGNGFGAFGSGATGRIRTGDPRIFSAMLYQLSYRGWMDCRLQIADVRLREDASIDNLQSTIGHPNLVGDDGLEPPTTSV
jgi:hypothetical protein